jgi:hypothetical protein
MLIDDLEEFAASIFRIEEWYIFSLGITAKSYVKIEVEPTSEMSFI